LIELHERWGDQAAWDRFVEQREEARFPHLWGYGQAVECYGYRPANLCFARDGEILAVLPAVRAKSLLFGRRLISQPFAEYGGLLVDERAGEEDLQSILGLLKDFLRSGKQGGTIEIHGNYGIPQRLRDSAFSSRNAHHIAWLDLARPAEQIWSGGITYEARKAVNKARKSGISVVEDSSESAIVGDFFPLYLQSMKRLGAPPHTVDYYLRCRRFLGARMRIYWAVLESRRIAALLGFTCGRRVSIVNIVSDPVHWGLRPNDLLHWEFIESAAREGYGYFDFGSVRYEGQERFKKKWGCELKEYAYYFMSGRDAATQAQTFDSSSPLMTRFSKLWADHVPDAVAAYCGPIIRRHLMR
jgi:CelD/BcsL family acetyltransferase involved in cellulose biosynthesis